MRIHAVRFMQQPHCDALWLTFTLPLTPNDRTSDRGRYAAWPDRKRRSDFLGAWCEGFAWALDGSRLNCRATDARGGYLRGLAAGSVAPSGALAMLISPSVLFIIYGAVSGVSVGPLCIGGIVVRLSSQLSGHSDQFLYNLQCIDVPVVIARDHLRNAIRKFLVLHHVLPGARLHCW